MVSYKVVFVVSVMFLVDQSFNNKNESRTTRFEERENDEETIHGRSLKSTF